MHRLVNIFAILTFCVGFLVIGGWQYQRFQTDGSASELNLATIRLKREVDRRAAMLETEKTPQGWPRKIDPTWFGSETPRNVWVTGGRPWLEIASADQSHMQDPVVRAVDDQVGADLAEFWYNPANGHVRARVPCGASDRETLALYNKVNSSTLDSLFETPTWRNASATDR